MKLNSKIRNSQRKLRSFADVEEFEGVIAKLLPTQKTFSEALSTIEAPLRALMNAINPMDSVQPALPAIKDVLATYLDQLDYLLRWSRINGNRVGEAKIEHPFWILELD